MHSDNIGVNAPGFAVPDTASTSASDDASPAANGGGVRDQAEQDKSDSATADVSGKLFATLQAELALRGFTLRAGNAADGTVRFYVGRWNLTRELPDLAAVATFLEQIGGAA